MPQLLRGSPELQEADGGDLEWISDPGKESRYSLLCALGHLAEAIFRRDALRLIV